MANETSTFSVVFDDKISTGAEDAAQALDEMRERMAASQQAIKDLAAQQRMLVGSTDEVKAARERLKAALGVEKSRLSANQLQMLKNGDAVKALSEQQKKAAALKAATEEKEKLQEKRFAALKKAKEEKTKQAAKLEQRRREEEDKKKKAAVDKLAKYNQSMKDSEAAAAAGSQALGMAIGGLTAGVAAFGVAAVAGIASMVKWAITGANAARSANLFREAAAGSSANAIALGTQVEALSMKVPTAKAALNELATSLAKGGIQGQTLVDTLNAVGQASAAMGDDAGGKLRELVDRGRLSQRFVVNPLELQGTGLQFDDIAKSLAASMKTGVAEARAALFEGRVKLADGAKALRDAVEQKFGKLNLRKMLDLNVIADKLKERFDALTEGINLEPMLEAFNKLVGLFDESTVTGAALKQLVTVFGTTFVSAMTVAAPLMKGFLEGGVIAALKLAIAFFTVKKAIEKSFGDKKAFQGVEAMKTALIAGEIVVGTFAVGVAALAGAVGALGLGIYYLVKPFVQLALAIKDAQDWLTKMEDRLIKSLDWRAIGTMAVEGLVIGLAGGKDKVKAAVEGLGAAAKNAFKNALQIKSPSRVFAEYGEHTAEGYAQGVEGGQERTNVALQGMADEPRQGKRGAGGGTAISIPVSITVNGSGDAAAQLTDPAFLARFTKLLEDALISAGVPVT